jgi:hypothetical protein
MTSNSEGRHVATGEGTHWQQSLWPTAGSSRDKRPGGATNAGSSVNSARCRHSRSRGFAARASTPFAQDVPARMPRG